MRVDLERAGRTLALDLVTGEVVRAMHSADIDCLVLKGPATVHWLYGDAPGIRNYGDIDLAVAPVHFDIAGRVLASLGFEDHQVGLRATEASRFQERTWERDGAVHVKVDLHRGFHHVTDWSAWWELLTVHRAVLVVEGQEVTVPDPMASALIAALHASKATSQRKALEDLRRALRIFDDDVWRQAADLAGSVGAGEAFAAALWRLPTGIDLAIRLGVSVTDPVRWLRATSHQHGVGSLSLVLEPGGWAVRARRLRDVVIPSRVVLARSQPGAIRGPASLLLAHLSRLVGILSSLRPLLLAWRRATRTMPIAGGAGPAPSPPDHGDPGLAGRLSDAEPPVA